MEDRFGIKMSREYIDQRRSQMQQIAQEVRDLETYSPPPHRQFETSYVTAEEAVGTLGLLENHRRLATEMVESVVSGKAILDVAKEARAAGFPRHALTEMIRRATRLRHETMKRSNPVVGKSLENEDDLMKANRRQKKKEAKKAAAKLSGSSKGGGEKRPQGFTQSIGRKGGFKNPATKEYWYPGQGVGSSPHAEDHGDVHAAHAKDLKAKLAETQSKLKPSPEVHKKFMEIKEKARKNNIEIKNHPDGSHTLDHMDQIEKRLDGHIARNEKIKAKQEASKTEPQEEMKEYAAEADETGEMISDLKATLGEVHALLSKQAEKVKKELKEAQDKELQPEDVHVLRESVLALRHMLTGTLLGLMSGGPSALAGMSAGSSRALGEQKQVRELHKELLKRQKEKEAEGGESPKKEGVKKEGVKKEEVKVKEEERKEVKDKEAAGGEASQAEQGKKRIKQEKKEEKPVAGPGPEEKATIEKPKGSTKAQESPKATERKAAKRKQQKASRKRNRMKKGIYLDLRTDSLVFAKAFTSEDVHDAADDAGIEWDDDADFMDRSEQLTGKRHLDDMSERELRIVASSLKKGEAAKHDCAKDHPDQSHEEWEEEQATMEKAGPFIGPRGGKWADAKHTIAWKDGAKAKPRQREFTDESGTKHSISPSDEQIREQAAYAHQKMNGAVSEWVHRNDDASRAKIFEIAGSLPPIAKAALAFQVEDIVREQSGGEEWLTVYRTMKPGDDSKKLAGASVTTDPKLWSHMGTTQAFRVHHSDILLHYKQGQLPRHQRSALGSGDRWSHEKEIILRPDASKIESLGGPALSKSSLFIGPRGGKWADAKHTIPWKKEKMKNRVAKKVHRRKHGKGRQVELTKSELSWVLKHGTFGLLSAGKNPKLEPNMSHADQAARHEKLRADLKKSGFMFTEVVGHYEGEENTFLVMAHDIGVRELNKLGKKYNQDSVIRTSDGKNNMYFTTGENEGKHHKGSGFEIKPDASDYFTVVDHKACPKCTPPEKAGKTKFALNFDWGAFHKAIVAALRGKPIISKAVFIGPRGGKWADAKHTIAWKPEADLVAKIRAVGGSQAKILAEHLNRGTVDAVQAKAWLTKQSKESSSTPAPKASHKMSREEWGASEKHTTYRVGGQKGGAGTFFGDKIADWAGTRHSKWGRDLPTSGKDVLILRGEESGLGQVKGDASNAPLAHRVWSNTLGVEMSEELRQIAGDSNWKNIDVGDAVAALALKQAGVNVVHIVDPKTRASVSVDLRDHAVSELRDHVSKMGDRKPIISKAVFIGPRGGKWADAKHTIPWKKEEAKPTKKPPGSQLPKRTQARLKRLGVAKLPEAAIPKKNISVDFTNPDTTAVIKWKDKAGRHQSGYTPEFHRANAAKKWVRIADLRIKAPKIIRGLQQRLKKSEAGSSKHQGLLVSNIVALTGLRPGSTKSLEDRFGVSTLQPRHVKITGNKVEFEFVGKQGKVNKATIRNKGVADALSHYMGGAKNENMFVAHSLTQARRTLPEGMKLKDFRTIKASDTAFAVLDSVITPPPLTGNRKKDKRLLAKALLAASKVVAKVINNTPEVARASYVHPEVFREWAIKKAGADPKLFEEV